MEQDLISALLGDSNITALVGTRVHWRERPQGQILPDVILHNLGGPADYHFQGPSGFKQTRVQVDCWSSRSKKEAWDVKTAVENLLSGLITSGSRVQIQGMFLDSSNDDVEVIGEAGTKYYRERLDFLVFSGDLGAT